MGLVALASSFSSLLLARNGWRDFVLRCPVRPVVLPIRAVSLLLLAVLSGDRRLERLCRVSASLG